MLRELDAPRDPKFTEKTRIILDLYAGFWGGRRLGRRDQIFSADEKTSIQARRRRQAAPGPGQPGRVESDYERCGALQRRLLELQSPGHQLAA